MGTNFNYDETSHQVIFDHINGGSGSGALQQVSQEWQWLGHEVGATGKSYVQNIISNILANRAAAAPPVMGGKRRAGPPDGGSPSINISSQPTSRRRNQPPVTNPPATTVSQLAAGGPTGPAGSVAGAGRWAGTPVPRQGVTSGALAAITDLVPSGNSPVPARGGPAGTRSTGARRVGGTSQAAFGPRPGADFGPRPTASSRPALDEMGAARGGAGSTVRPGVDTVNRSLEPEAIAVSRVASTAASISCTTIRTRSSVNSRLPHHR